MPSRRGPRAPSWTEDLLRRVHLALVAALAAPGLVRADLGLPKKTVVVKDFARLRQDLLDTLRVNLPDGEVEIQQFRGAEVVLKVRFTPKTKPDNEVAARIELRTYLDGLIREAAPGMELSGDSELELLEPLPPPPEENAEDVAILDRLRSALDEFGDAGVVVASSDAPVDPAVLAAADAATQPDPDAEAGPNPVVGVAGASKRDLLLKGGLKNYMAAIRSGKVPDLASAPPRPIARPAAAAGRPVTDETARMLEAYAPAEAPPETGEAQAELRQRAQTRKLVEGLNASAEVSEETIEKVAQFRSTGKVLDLDSSLDTVRQIYRDIWSNRGPGRPQGPTPTGPILPSATRSMNVPRWVSDHVDEGAEVIRPGEVDLASLVQAQPAAAPAPATGLDPEPSDDGFFEGIEALFDSDEGPGGATP